MLASDFRWVAVFMVKLDGKVRITIIFFDFYAKHAVYTPLTTSQIGIYGYQKKGLEIIYTLVFVRSR